MSTAQTTASRSPTHSKEIFGHPKGLYLLFFTEMWERFSYYGMRALLVLYMTKALFLDPQVGQTVLGFDLIKNILEKAFGPLAAQPLASQIYGLYTGFVYLSPFFGGILADRVLGRRKSVVVGGVLMAIGHFLMASPHLFFPALLFLILGNGCFKPNISTQVGNLYAPDDPRRDGAFVIFYMGVNLGAFLSPLICGTLGQKLGWHYGFGAAGVGMVLGLAIYLLGRHLLPMEKEPEIPSGKSKNGLTVQILFGLVASMAVFMLFLVLPGLLKGVIGIALVGLVIFAILQIQNREDRSKVGALVALCALNIMFWAVYEQQGNTMQIFADNNTDWVFFGWEVPSTWFQSFNSAFIFMMGPFLTMFWNRQGERQPSSISKMAIGCVLLGLAFIVMIAEARVIGENGKGSVMWLVASTFVYTIGELYLSPIGLSLVTKVAPKNMVSMMMGMWFLSSFFGNYLCGFIGMFYERMSKEAFFTMLTFLGIGTGLAIMAFNRPLAKAIGRKV